MGYKLRVSAAFSCVSQPVSADQKCAIVVTEASCFGQSHIIVQTVRKLMV